MVKQLAAEMRDLAPVLTAAPAPAVVRPMPPQLANTVQVRAIGLGNSTWLLAANAARTPATVRFSLPVAIRGNARVKFEGRIVAINGGQFSERFSGYERHVYEIPAVWPVNATITLNMTSENIPPGPASPVNNLARNLIVECDFENKGQWTFATDEGVRGRIAGRLDMTTSHAGKRCALIEATDAIGGGGWVGPRVTLKANTRYTFGGWAKAEMEGETHRRSVTLQLEAKSQSFTRAWTLPIEHFAGWQQHRAIFMMPGVDVLALPRCRVSSNSKDSKQGVRGRAWFDDLFLREASHGIRNLIVNGGFEDACSPGWPAHWDCEAAYPAPGAIGGTGALWGMDATQPFEGQYCLRMTGSEKAPAAFPFRHQEATQELVPFIALQEARDYVFSAQMRADKPNREVRVTMGTPGLGSTLKLTTEWRRYSIKIRPKETIKDAVVRISSLQAEGIVWADAVQLEEGAEPTEYREWRE
jgi:hypothetical protein